MSYSLDFRQRVFKLKTSRSLTYRETSELFGLNIRTLFRWKKNMQPKGTRNKPATKVDMEALKQDVIHNPDRYQYERAQDLGVSKSAIFYALKRLGMSYKKNTISPQSQLKR